MEGKMIPKVRWGVLSTAKIGMEKVIPAMQSCRYGEIVAIASRNIVAAREAAYKLNIPRYYGTYEELLADPEIDAVYIPVPNHLHVFWTIRAMEAGKHVLCEKPLAMNYLEAQSLLEKERLYPRLKVMEAFMYRHHFQWMMTRRIVAEGGIGELRTIQSFFSYFNDDPSNIRNIHEAGGGGLMDIGCYCISLARYLFNREPSKVCGVIDRHPIFHTDRMFSGIMDFGTGTSTFTCSTELQPFQRVVVLGTEGGIELELPFNPRHDRQCLIRLMQKGKMEVIPSPSCNQYTEQGDAFSKAILDDSKVPFPLGDAAANMKWLEILQQSADEQRWLADVIN
jgi:predicted dehydrogenase